MDAWGKIPSGVMRGNLFWLGSVDECQHHLRGFNNSIVEQPFFTRTCVIGNGYSNRIRPVYGICVPQSCTAEDIVHYVNQRENISSSIEYSSIDKRLLLGVIHIPMGHLSNDSVHCIDQRRYDTKAILTM